MISVNSIELDIDDVGSFVVFSNMTITFQLTQDGDCWKSHVSKLNEGAYPLLYASFSEFVLSMDESEQFDLTFNDFRAIMQTLFLAYAITK